LGLDGRISGIPSALITEIVFTSTQSNIATYQWNRGVPEGCSDSGHSLTCDIFVGINGNSKDNNMLDFALEANARGWVAIGFSKTPNMV
jgi:hypothetical protein